jgi:rifampicin phosphotransferase
MNNVFPLGAVSSDNEARIGQKAANLNRLMRAGFPIPAGICVPIDVFRAAISPIMDRIDPLLTALGLDDPTQAWEVSQNIAILLENLTIPTGVLAEICQALQPFGGEAFAVRSSSTLEDLPYASLAGQYKSSLGVVGAHGIQEAVLACWKSYFSANALSARAKFLGESGKDLKSQHNGMGVLIQPLIDAECAGVCFSVDPVSLNPQIITVASTWGLGIGVVDGSIPADNARVRRTDLGIEELSATKKLECIRPGIAGGLQRVAVPEEQQSGTCLPVSWLQRVAQFGLAAEQTLNWPQDVEWAIAEERIWILQSRSITTLPAETVAAVQYPVEWADDEEPHHFWWQEQIHDWPEIALLPIELDFVKERTEGGQEAVEYGGFAETRWRKAVHGRVYITRAVSPADPNDRIQRSAAFKEELDNLVAQDITLWEYWGPEIEHTTRRLAAYEPDDLDGNSLAEHLEDTLAAAKRHWMIHTLVPRRFDLAGLGEAYRQITGRDDPEVEEEVQSLILGEESIHTRLIEAIYDLAQLAGQHPSLAGLVASRPANVMDLLFEMPEARDFIVKFKHLMAYYGGRILYRRQNDPPATLPLPWREAPEHVLEMVAAYLPKNLGQDIVSPKKNRERVARETRIKIEALFSEMKDPAAIESFRRCLEYTRRNAVFRDEHNHYIDQLAEGQFLQAVLHAGGWLAARGDLTRREDAYWLLIAEILPALRNPEKQDLGNLVAERKHQFARWRELIAPASLGLPESRLPERAQERLPSTTHQPAAPDPGSSSDHTLIGQAGSRGKAWGRVRLIHETARMPDVVPGEVLVAKNAGPLWTPVLASLAGIVLEEGSAADHVAIMAREYGIPAVMNVTNAIQRIPAGAWVLVDGTRGVVEW